RRRHTRSDRDWSSDVCSSDLIFLALGFGALRLGLIRPVTTYVASEASPAIERVSEAAAGGLKKVFGANPLKSESVVKVKCRNCRSEERRVGKECRTRRWRYYA